MLIATLLLGLACQKTTDDTGILGDGGSADGGGTDGGAIQPEPPGEEVSSSLARDLAPDVDEATLLGLTKDNGWRSSSTTIASSKINNLQLFDARDRKSVV